MTNQRADELNLSITIDNNQPIRFQYQKKDKTIISRLKFDSSPNQKYYKYIH